MPEPEQALAPGLNGTDHGARSALGMIAGRQRHGTLEGLGHDGMAGAVSQPIGECRNDGARNDAEQTKCGPETNIGKRFAAFGERINDPAKQDRFGKLYEAKRNAGCGERDGQEFFRRQ